VFHTNGILFGLAVDQSRYIAVATIKDPHAPDPRQNEIWNLQTIQRMCSFPGIAEAIGREKGLIAIYNDKPCRISLFDIADCSLRNTYKIDMDPFGIDIISDGAILAVGGDTLQFWDSATGLKFLEFDKAHHVTGVAFSPDGNYLATASAAPPGGKTKVSLWMLKP
jgi:WD40 repeat protein